MQWLNPNAFVSSLDPSTGACFGGDSSKNCQFGSLRRNALHGPNFAWSDFYLTKWFASTERVKMRFDAQFFNVFNPDPLTFTGVALALAAVALAACVIPALRASRVHPMVALRYE